MARRLIGTGAGISIERNIAVDALSTGADFVFLSGCSNPNLPTGVNIAFTVNYGFPAVNHNWSFHSDPAINADLMNHFGILCEYG